MGRERVDIGDIDLEAMAIFTGVDVGTLRVRLYPAELAAKLEAARTVEELWALREFAPRGSAIERELLTKTEMLLRTELESATSLEELRGVCRSGRGTIVEREALLKMAPFFPKKDAT